MDLVKMIVSALAMGAVAAAASVGGQALKDAYSGLKTLIISRFGTNTDVQKAVEDLETKPKSAGRKATAEEELNEAGAGEDAEIVAAAQTLMKVLEKPEVAGANILIAHAESGGGIAQGTKNIIATSGAVVNEGKVQGDISASGSAKT